MSFLRPNNPKHDDNAQIQRGQDAANQARLDRQKVAAVRAARNLKTERAANSHLN